MYEMKGDFESPARVERFIRVQFVGQMLEELVYALFSMYKLSHLHGSTFKHVVEVRRL